MGLKFKSACRLLLLIVTWTTVLIFFLYFFLQSQKSSITFLLTLINNCDDEQYFNIDIVYIAYLFLFAFADTGGPYNSDTQSFWKRVNRFIMQEWYFNVFYFILFIYNYLEINFKKWLCFVTNSLLHGKRVFASPMYPLIK